MIEDDIKAFVESSKQLHITCRDNDGNMVYKYKYKPVFEFNDDVSIKDINFIPYKVV